jgi:dTDP-4-amino-4,6-dideoxygalactose transaminase
VTRRADLPHKQLTSVLGEVCRPLLPTAERLLPYLQSIDRRRWYSNWGELSKTLESRLSAHFGLVEYGCVTTSNATDAIAASLIAVAGRGSAERRYCLMPSYTFVATASAALDAGYVPYFVDVDPATFAMNPAALEEHPELPRVGAIVAVAPYGRALDAAAWQRLSERTGVPVVIDAAAGFDSFFSGIATAVRGIPVVLSFHATKVFGVGEGGAILCSDVELSKNCRRALNFGFFGSREAQTAGTNGKMSEYHAAVGLAELDEWPAKRSRFLRVAHAYSRAAERLGIGDRIVVERAWASSYALYLAETGAAAARAAERLAAAGFGFRWWYGDGVHREPGYAGFPSDSLPVTDDLAPRLIGLPVWVDLDDDAVTGVLAAIAQSLEGARL